MEVTGNPFQPVWMVFGSQYFSLHTRLFLFPPFVLQRLFPRCLHYQVRAPGSSLSPPQWSSPRVPSHTICPVSAPGGTGGPRANPCGWNSPGAGRAGGCHWGAGVGWSPGRSAAQRRPRVAEEPRPEVQLSRGRKLTASPARGQADRRKAHCGRRREPREDGQRQAPAPARRQAGDRRHRPGPAQRGPAPGPLPKGVSQSLARPVGPAPEGTGSRPPSHSASRQAPRASATSHL